MQSPAPASPRDPYTVERYPALNGAVRLLGYDGNGEPAVDMTIPRHRYKPEMMAKMQQWLMRDDAAEPVTPALRLAR